MAMTTSRTRCVTCEKEKSTLRCEGCQQTFCYNHVIDHRQALSKQLDEVEVSRDLFWQTLSEQTVEPQKHPLIQQVDEWEAESINKIRQTAEGVRKLLRSDAARHSARIILKLNKFTEQLRESRQENDFVETDLNDWKKQLTELQEEFNKPSNVTIRHDSTTLVTKILADVPGKSHYPPPIEQNIRFI
jgi:hypothetical protein